MDKTNEILDLIIGEVVERVKDLGIHSLEIKESLKKKILEEGYNPEYGARPLKRSVQKKY